LHHSVPTISWQAFLIERICLKEAVAVAHPDLSPSQQAWFESAVALIDLERLYRVNRELTAIHSPTGRERAASEYMARYLAEVGVETIYQPMGEQSGNVIGRVRGAGGGPSLLLYAPIDTHLDAIDSDVPWVGPRLREDMIPHVSERDGLVIGLGASNPKAMVTTLAEAVRVVHAAKVPLMGDLLVAYAGGGMPVDLPESGNRGLSDGVSHLLARGVHTDFALVMKPGNAVYHEEPGLCWFKISVKGTLGYAGMPHGLPRFRSSIVPAAKVILELEDWLPRYTERNTSGQVAPQGWIAAVRAGWPERVAFPSATTEVYLDIRCNPRTPPAEVRAQFESAITEILARHPEVELEWDMIASLPGASTDPQNWIVRSAIRAWEQVEGKPHQTPPHTSGQTDISMIRNLGIPTARTGWVATPEKTPVEYRQGLGGMGVSYPPDLAVTCRKLIYSIVDTCTRTRAEVGCLRKP
jgi:acetylornithine deacetylase/succinyl-diaminopimelate desuccinylase-like protein